MLRLGLARASPGSAGSPVAGRQRRPDLGQGYIIDSFLVVVLGGVGQLAGSVLAAFGLGVETRSSNRQIGAVLGKILILALIVLFIQKRPQELFALKGRGSSIEPATHRHPRPPGRGRVTAIALGAAFATLLAMPLLAPAAGRTRATSRPTA